MARQLQHLVDGVPTLSHRLQREPFVEHQGVVMKASVKGVERLLPFRRSQRNEDAERALSIGHVVGTVELRLGEASGLRLVGRGDQPQRYRPQPARALGGRR